MTRPTDRPPTAPPTGRTRLGYIDDLRTALTVLVVVHHAAITYSTIPRWYYEEPVTDSSATLLDILVVLNQSFFMGAFFLISGFFVPGALDRRGARGFIGERLLRLGVPLLIWVLVVRVPVTVGPYIEARDLAVAQGSDLPYWRFYLESVNPGPMWFVEVLFAFSLLYVLWRIVVPTDRSRIPATVPARAPGVVAIVGFGVGVAVVTYLWRIAVGMDDAILGLPSPAYLPQYAALFVVGLLAVRRGWLEALSARAGRLGFATAAVASVAVLALLVLDGEAFLGGGTWQSLVMALCESALALGAVIGLLVLFRDRAGRQGPVRRFLSAHAYAVYLVHPVVLVGVSYALRGVAAPAAGKFVLLTVLSLPLCWGVAYLVRALPGARRVF